MSLSASLSHRKTHPIKNQHGQSITHQHTLGLSLLNHLSFGLFFVASCLSCPRLLCLLFTRLIVLVKAAVNPLRTESLSGCFVFVCFYARIQSNNIYVTVSQIFSNLIPHLHKVGGLAKNTFWKKSFQQRLSCPDLGPSLTILGLFFKASERHSNTVITSWLTVMTKIQYSVCTSLG